MHLPRLPDLKDPVSLFKEEATMNKVRGPLTSELLHRPAEFGLGNLPAEQGDVVKTVKSVCGFCSTGCSLTLHLDENGAKSLTPTPDYPVNIGMACPKGWEALAVTEAPNRAQYPSVRLEKGGETTRVSWQEAANLFCDKMKGIQEKHGKESIAFISTGQIPFEEMAFLGSLFKFGMGGLHGDGNTRQCMATAVVAYKQSFGFDAPPYTYADFEESDHNIFIGANPCIAHPIMWQRVLRNKRDAEITVIDPRFTETAQCANTHFPIQPKSDQILFYGVANLIFQAGRHNEEFLNANTEGWKDFREFVKQYDLETVVKTSGISAEELEEFAVKISDPSKRTAFWWTMGVNQSHQGVRTAQAIINLALMTGNIGKPGTGANSITGQCNAMGSRLFSNTTGLLGGHDFTNAAHREKIAGILEIPADVIPEKNSYAYDQIIEGIRNDEIKGLWVIATNPAHSWIHQNDFHELREKLDFLVVQDMYHDTETAQMADLTLPVAAWAEKNGCFINSERRVSTIRQVKKAPGEALSDFRIFQLLAHTWGCGEMFKKWTSPEAAFEILQKCSKGQPCDISGIRGYAQLEERGGIQWPCPEGMEEPVRERRLFEDAQFYTPSRKAKVLFEESTEVKELPDDEYPYHLNTGRGTSSQWHTQTRTKQSAILRKLYPQDPYAEIHPEDALEQSILNDEWILVKSRRGEIKVRAYIAPTVQRGHIFVPMHDDQSNKLTNPDFDRYSRQPSYKTGAVMVEKA